MVKKSEKNKSKNFNHKDTTQSVFGSGKHLLFLLFVLSLLIVFVYSGALKGEFLNWDDNDIVLDNDAVKALNAASIHHTFTNIYSGDYRPLTIVTYGIIHYFFGLNPWAFHAFNVLLHIINIILVFFLCRRFVCNVYLCAFAAAIWGVHPMLSEPVSWISGLNDMLYAVFIFGGLILYDVYLKTGKALKWLTFVFLCFFCALLVKPHALVFPALLFLFDYYRDKPFTLKSAVEKSPFIFLAVVFAFVTVYGRTGETDVAVLAYSIGQRIMFAFYIYAVLILKFLAPVGLSALHDFPRLTAGFPLVYWVAPLLPVLLIVLILKLKQYRKILLFGLLFFSINVSVVLQLIPFGTFLYAERFAYVAYSGLVIMLTILYQKTSLKLKFGSVQTALFALFVVFLFSLLTVERTKVWRDNFSLWGDVLKNNPKSLMALNNLGLAHYAAGNMHDAYQCYNRALAFDPHNYNAYVNRGNVKHYLGDYKGAENDFSTAIGINTNNKTAYNNRANTRVALKDIDGALADYTAAIAIDSGYVDALFNRGILYSEMGLSNKSVADFNHVLTMKPGNINAYFNRADELVKLQEYDRAIDDLNTIIEIKPDIAEAYFNKGVVFMSQDQNNKALDNFRKAIQINPDYANAYFNKGIVNTRLNMIDKACADFIKAQSLGLDASGTIKQFCN